MGRLVLRFCRVYVHLVRTPAVHSYVASQWRVKYLFGFSFDGNAEAFVQVVHSSNPAVVGGFCTTLGSFDRHRRPPLNGMEGPYLSADRFHSIQSSQRRKYMDGLPGRARIFSIGLGESIWSASNEPLSKGWFFDSLHTMSK